MLLLLLEVATVSCYSAHKPWLFRTSFSLKQGLGAGLSAFLPLPCMAAMFLWQALEVSALYYCTILDPRSYAPLSLGQTAFVLPPRAGSLFFLAPALPHSSCEHLVETSGKERVDLSRVWASVLF